jgi:hypothetical protein
LACLPFGPLHCTPSQDMRPVLSYKRASLDPSTCLFYFHSLYYFPKFAILLPSNIFNLLPRFTHRVFPKTILSCANLIKIQSERLKRAMTPGLGEMIIDRLTPTVANLSDSIYKSHLWSRPFVGETWGPNGLVLGTCIIPKDIDPLKRR